MKIKQSFIDRCGEITLKEVHEIQRIRNCTYFTVINALLEPQEYSYATDIWKATAIVLKISLSDIYEVEPLPHTL